MDAINEKLLEGLLAVKILIAEKDIEKTKALLVTGGAETEEFMELIREGIELEETADRINSLIDIRRK